jgi:hypothetical protein
MLCVCNISCTKTLYVGDEGELPRTSPPTSLFDVIQDAWFLSLGDNAVQVVGTRNNEQSSNICVCVVTLPYEIETEPML